EGQSWRTMLAEDDPATRSDERLAEHLRVLLRVTEALAFAHAQGVIHRDLKPENVMVGRFGEVYLLDWGIAVTLRDDADPRVPRLSEETDITGTPHYMAPEMASGARDRQGPATDVFLLGATLYEVLTGRTPYQGRTPLSLMVAATRGRIEPLPPFVDRRLGALTLEAMRLDPAERPASVTALADRIRAWLEQRPALRLLDDAAGRIAALEAAVEAPSVNRMAREADFDGIRATLAQVAPLLPAGVVEPFAGRAAVAMARVALAEGDPEAARVRLSLPGVQIDPEVLAPLEMTIRQQRLEQARKAAEAEKMDRRVGRRVRGIVGLPLGALWVLLPLHAAVTGAIPPLTVVATGNAAIGLVVLALFAARWQHLGGTVPNRLLLLSWIIATFGFALFEYWGDRQGFSPQNVYVIQLLMVTIIAGIYSIGIEPRSWPVIFTTAAATFVGAMLPDQVMAVTAANNFFIVAILLYAAWTMPRTPARSGA
ncbi:MAG: protein kinase, partial [Myxococcales bacterium]|nr:protein kinase [Myxococcales bacterium]